MNNTTLGKRVRARRQEVGISQLQLAINAKISQGYISQLEQGKYNPTAPVPFRISKALKISLDELLDEEERRAG